MIGEQTDLEEELAQQIIYWKSRALQAEAKAARAERRIDRIWEMLDE